MERFGKTAISAKRSIIDVWQASKYESSNNLDPVSVLVNLSCWAFTNQKRVIKVTQ